MINSPLQPGQSLYLREDTEDSRFILTLQRKEVRKGVTFWWILWEELKGTDRVKRFDCQPMVAEEWIRRSMDRVCRCRRHPSPDGWCELPIEDKKFVKNTGFCTWCHEGHPTAERWVLIRGVLRGSLRRIKWALVSRR